MNVQAVLMTNPTLYDYYITKKSKVNRIGEKI